jgi:hypothetical protein
MHQHKTCGRMNDHRTKYLPWVRKRFVKCPFAHIRTRDPAILHVQEHHSHDLLSETPHFKIRTVDCLSLIQRAGQRLFCIDHARHRQAGYHRFSLTPGQELTQLPKRCAMQLFQRPEVL